ncbi:MAG: hypothetical protein K0S47_2943 [Herbinix sp.]|jgi:hypothetical protein|nr:hypothetical protein [Herbinix sp.]
MKGVHLMRENFLLSLEIMGKGMAGIFVVILLLTFIVMILTSLTAKKKDQDEA